MNFNLPDSTAFNRRVPKQKFYENLAVSAVLKRSLIDEIKTVWWRNKLAAKTLNLAKGTVVTEIEVFEIELANGELNEDILRQMDRMIPYHLLFVLTFENRAQAWIGYKEASATGENAFKVNRYYHTDWIPREALRFTLSGLTLDEVYENLVRQIAAQQGFSWKDGSNIAANVVRDVTREKMAKQIAALEAKMRRERQLNRKMELSAELKRLRKELEA